MKSNINNIYNINFFLLRKARERGFCLCDVKRTRKNQCPCETFLETGICKCHVYVKVEKKETEIGK